MRLVRDEHTERLVRMEQKLDRALEELHSSRHFGMQLKAIWAILFTTITGILAMGWDLIKRGLA